MGKNAMVLNASRLRCAADRALRSACRCDGLKDLAVVAALLAISGAFAVHVASAARVSSFL
jgi:hypothetical protein